MDRGRLDRYNEFTGSHFSPKRSRMRAGARKGGALSPMRLMTYGMFALGAVMIIVGLIYISSGVAIIRMELGWSEVVGGSVAASAGCVVIALGRLALQMEALRDAMLRAMRGEQQS